jgi:hypothetical protein
MGKGIAVDFKKRFGRVGELKAQNVEEGSAQRFHGRFSIVVFFRD